MASLVTTGSAPYNPYNNDFASFALKGLDMAQRDMAQTDERNARSVQNVMQIGAMAADAIKTNAELKLKWADQERLKQAQAAQLEMERSRLDLATEAQAFEQKKWSDMAPVRQLQAKEAEVGIRQAETAITINQENARRLQIENDVATELAPFKVEADIATLANAPVASAVKLYSEVAKLDIAAQRAKGLAEAASSKTKKTALVDAFKNTPSAIMETTLDEQLKPIQSAVGNIDAMMKATREKEGELGSPIKEPILSEPQLQAASKGITAANVAAAQLVALKSLLTQASPYEASGSAVPADLSKKIQDMRSSYEKTLREAQKNFSDVAPGWDSGPALLPGVGIPSGSTTPSNPALESALKAAAAVDEFLK